jgi:hypothetical protein
MPVGQIVEITHPMTMISMVTRRELAITGGGKLGRITEPIDGEGTLGTIATTIATTGGDLARRKRRIGPLITNALRSETLSRITGDIGMAAVTGGMTTMTGGMKGLAATGKMSTIIVDQADGGATHGAMRKSPSDTFAATVLLQCAGERSQSIGEALEERTMVSDGPQCGRLDRTTIEPMRGTDGGGHARMVGDVTFGVCNM